MRTLMICIAYTVLSEETCIHRLRDACIFFFYYLLSSDQTSERVDGTEFNDSVSTCRLHKYIYERNVHVL